MKHLDLLFLLGVGVLEATGQALWGWTTLSFLQILFTSIVLGLTSRTIVRYKDCSLLDWLSYGFVLSYSGWHFTPEVTPLSYAIHAAAFWLVGAFNARR